MLTLPLNSLLYPLRDPVFTQKQVEVFIKRDDLIHPFISGNKWRKLKYLLLQAQEEQKTRLVTFGGPWSNHLLATACAAAVNGLKSTGFVRGERVTNLVTTLCETFGMQLIFTTRRDYRDKPALFHTHFNEDTALFIDEGGAGPEAARGCAELIGEIDHPFDHIFCPAGTGTTAAGMVNGVTAQQLNARVHAVQVMKGEGSLAREIGRLLIAPGVFTLHTGYHFGGYAKTTPELIRFIRQFTAATGILPDPVYTGKMLFAIYDLVRNDFFAPGESIVAVHTGGLTGLAGKLEEFSKV